MTDWTPPNSEYPPPKPDEPPLFRAAREGDHDAIRAIAAGNLNLYGRAALDDVFNIRLDPGARECPATPLMVAAGSGDGATVETVRLLIELGADPTATTKAGSAAGFAAIGLGWNYRPGGDAARLRALLDAGSPLPLTGLAGAELVARTAATGDAERLAVLLERGGPANAIPDPENPPKGMADMFKEPLVLPDSIGDEAKAMLTSAYEMMKNDPDLFPDAGEEPPGPYPHVIPLFSAAESGSAACVRLLLEAGAAVHQLDHSGETALFCATSPEVVATLAAAGIDLNRRHLYGGDALKHQLDRFEPDSPENGRIAAVCQAILAAGVPLDHALNADQDRLWEAAFAENALAVRFLLDAGCSVATSGATALHALCWHWDHGDERDEVTRAIVRMLLAAGISPDARSDEGNTPLHDCVAGDGANVVAAEVLLAAGADVNARNDEGQTPLVFLYETHFQYDRFVPLLLEHGADPRIPNNRGKNAIDLAKQMIRGENPDWRVEQWAEKEGGVPCGWKGPASEGDEEYQLLDMLIAAAERLDAG